MLFVVLMVLSAGAVVATVSADEPPADAAQPAQAAPRGELPPLLQRLWQQPRATFKIGNVPPDNPRATGAKDYIDARAPRDLPTEAFWNNARVALDAGDWKRGVEWTRKLLDMPGDAVIRTGKDQWQSLHAAAQARLSAAPREVRGDYERQYGGLAQQLLTEAHRTGSVDRLVEVATRFFHTRAGAEAANTLASRHVDRQEFTLAWRWFRELEAGGAEITRNPRWRFKAAVAARQADPAAAAALIQSLGSTPVDIGGRRLSAREAWDALPKLPSAANAELTDWPQAYGTAARVGSVSPGEPLLQLEWSQPMSTQPVIRQRIDELVRDLQDESAVTLLAAQPIAIGDRVAFRTLRGVRVVSASSGKTLWETAVAVSPEHILLGQPPREAGSTAATRFIAAQGSVLDDPYVGDMVEFHPLSNLLFRDATVGLIGSDGERLFVLEDVAVLTRNQSGYHWDDSSEADDPYGMAWGSNRLTAYDLATGREQWTIGGPASDDPNPPPLAGAFFLGAPLAVGNELFVVATQGEEIRLWNLNAATGRPKWWQLLAYADTKIDRDIGRRWFGAPVASSEGIVVCPTTVGWLVAVDPLRRRLLWVHRYLPPVDDPQSDPGAQFTPQMGFNDQWAAGSPVIAGQSVLFAPPESEDLFCLNLTDGALRWQHPRDEGVYLAGAAEGKVLVVEAHGVRALSLDTGESLWHCPWDATVHPLGRGVIAGDQFVLPLSSREVWSIEIAAGAVAQKSVQPEGQPALGNLIKAGGRWISLSAEGCTGFGERQQITAELAATLKQNAHDVNALLRGTEIRLLDGDFDGAAEQLQQLPADLAGDAARRRRELRWRLLSRRVQQNPSGSGAVFDELEQLARSPEDALHVTVWRADQLAAQGQIFEAFEQLARAALNDGPDWVTRPDAPEIRVRRIAWLSGRIADLHAKAQPDVRARIDDAIRSRMAHGDLPAQRLASVFDFHPAAARLWWRLADDRAAVRDWSAAEAMLARCSEHRDAAVAVESRLRLAQLWIQWGVGEDARPLMQRLTAQSGSVALSDGRRISDAVRALDSELPANANEVARPSVRLPAKWEARQSPTLHAPPTQELVPPLGWPAWQRFAMQVEPQDQRVTFQTWGSDHWQWLAPLRTSARGMDQNFAPAEFVDHRLWVLSRDVLHLLSPFERKVVWTRTLDALADSQNSRQAMRTLTPSLTDPSDEDAGFDVWDRWTNHRGALAVANRRTLCLVGRRELTVLDPLTGGEIWRKTGLSPQALVFGGTNAVYVLQQHRDPPQAEAFRADDGRPLVIAKLAERLAHALTLRGDDFILAEARHTWGLSLFPSKTTLRRWNPFSDTDVWKLEFAPESQVGLAGDDGALVLPALPAGASFNAPRQLEWIDLDDGSRHKLSPVVLGNARNGCIPLVDEDRLYLVANSVATPTYHYGDNLPSIPVHGRVAAWDRQTGQLLWDRDVAEQHLVLDRFRSSPVLLFLNRSWKQHGNSSYTQLSLLALNKQTKQTLYESTAPSSFSGFHGVVVRPAEPSVELQSYNLKLHLAPVAP